MAEDDIRHYSRAELEQMARDGDTVPTRADAPEIRLDEAFWRTARLVVPGNNGKTSVHLRLDPEVLEWFRSQGKGHLTRMSAVLRAYMEANRDKR
ncbi:MAG: BrnA antitoxin family protein [Rhodospirillales bacterium]|nr:BrnA antitoxin family protein [Rhodospirillales bacterium]